MPSNNLSIDPKRESVYDRYDAAIALPICSEEPNDDADLYLPDDGLKSSPPAFTIPGPWRTELLVKESRLLSDMDEPLFASVLPILTVAEFVQFIHTILKSANDSLWDRSNGLEARSALDKLLLESAIYLAAPGPLSISGQLRITSLRILNWRENYAHFSPVIILEQTRILAIQTALQTITVALREEFLDLEGLKGLSTELAQIQTLLSPQERERLNPAYRGGPVSGRGDMARELGCQIARACLPFVQEFDVPQLPHLAADDPFFSGAYEGAGLFEEAARYYRSLETLAGIPSHRNTDEAKRVYRQVAAVSDAYFLLQRMHRTLARVEDALQKPGSISAELPLRQAEPLFERAALDASAADRIEDLPPDSDPARNPYHSTLHVNYVKYRYYLGLYRASPSQATYHRVEEAADTFLDGLGGKRLVPPSWVQEVGNDRIGHLLVDRQYAKALSLLERLTTQTIVPEKSPEWPRILSTFHEKAGDLQFRLANNDTDPANVLQRLDQAYLHYEAASVLGATPRLSERLIETSRRAKDLGPEDAQRVWQGRFIANQYIVVVPESEWTERAPRFSEETAILSQTAERVLERLLGEKARELYGPDSLITMEDVRAFATRHSPSKEVFLIAWDQQMEERGVNPDPNLRAIAMVILARGMEHDSPNPFRPVGPHIAVDSYRDALEKASSELRQETGLASPKQETHGTTRKGGTNQKPTDPFDGNDLRGPGRRGK